MKNKTEIRETLKNGNEIRTEATGMVNGGTIRWTWNPRKEIVESYGRGPGWCDQGVSEHELEDAVSYLWKQRRYILKEVA